MKHFFLSILLLGLLTASLSAQHTIRSGKTYHSGDSMAAPKYGITYVMPEAWSGYVLLDSDLLTIYLDSLPDVEAVYFARHSNLRQIEKNWEKGVEVAPGIRLELTAKPAFVHGVLYAPVHLTNNANRGFMFSKCGMYGNCVTMLVSCPARYFNQLNGHLGALINNIGFDKPHYADPNEFIDWKKLLTGKHLFDFETVENSKKETQIWLYYNGSFKSKVKRTGVFKGTDTKYQGTKKGTYWISNDEDGKGAFLTLYFHGMPKLELKLRRDDRHYYLGDDKVFFEKIAQY